MKQRLFVTISFLIVACTFFLRIYHVTTNPPALSWDEVSIGYNAYSILNTGKDEHGKQTPLDAFTGFGDYKPPVSIYMTVPFVAVFGLNELSVRLPSVLAGTFTAAIIMFLVYELFAKDPRKKRIALASGILVSISPWHVLISRAGFEANTALLFVVLGVYAVLKARNKPSYFYIAACCFALCIYTFNSTRYFVPMLLMIFVLQYKTYKKHKASIIKAGILFFVLLLPILSHLLSKESRLRFTEVNIFSDINIINESNVNIAREQNSVFSKVIHNRRIGFARSFLFHFFDHFDPRFLFIRGDGNPKFSIQDTGQMYMIEAPIFIIGALSLASTNSPLALFLFLWIVAAIIPASVARETPHALRILNSLPPVYIFVSYGLIVVCSSIRRFFLKRLVVVSIAGIYMVLFMYFWHTYMVHFPMEYSGEWQYGYKQTVEYIVKVQQNYERVVISDVIGRPYMYTLFYTKFDPLIYLRIKKSYFDADGFYHVDSFDRYHFVTNTPVNFEKNTLYALHPSYMPKSARLLQTIKLLNGTPIIAIFDTP